MFLKSSNSAIINVIEGYFVFSCVGFDSSQSYIRRKKIYYIKTPLNIRNMFYLNKKRNKYYSKIKFMFLY